MKVQTTKNPIDLNYMLEAFKIAEAHPDETRAKAIGAIVVKDKKIIGRGFRKRVFHENGKSATYHAEHVAIMDAILKHGGKLVEATLYTTLEPCKIRLRGERYIVPKPCCEIIEKALIKRVVIGFKDENFGGGGIQYLLEKGVSVAVCEGLDEKYKDLVKDDFFLHEEDKKHFKKELTNTLTKKK